MLVRSRWNDSVRASRFRHAPSSMTLVCSHDERSVKKIRGERRRGVSRVDDKWPRFKKIKTRTQSKRYAHFEPITLTCDPSNYSGFEVPSTTVGCDHTIIRAGRTSDKQGLQRRGATRKETLQTDILVVSSPLTPMAPRSSVASNNSGSFILVEPSPAPVRSAVRRVGSVSIHGISSSSPIVGKIKL